MHVRNREAPSALSGRNASTFAQGPGLEMPNPAFLSHILLYQIFILRQSVRNLPGLSPISKMLLIWSPRFSHIACLSPSITIHERPQETLQGGRPDI